MRPHVEVHDLVKVYRRSGVFQWEGRFFPAVNGVSLEIARGSILGLVGESGSGKSTLARSILCLDPPTSGSIRVGDVDPMRLRGRGLREFRRTAQMIFQDVDRALDPRMTVGRSIEEALANRGVLPGNFRERTAELLSLVGISAGSMDSFPSAFSGGQRQRIVIARALAMEASFLILDEPVSNLDVSVQAQIINLLLSLRNKFGLTYLFISHDLNLVSYLSDTVSVMKEGVIVESGSTESVIGDPRHPYTRTLLAAAPRFVFGNDDSGSPRSIQ